MTLARIQECPVIITHTLETDEYSEEAAAVADDLLMICCCSCCSCSYSCRFVIVINQ